MFGVLPTGFRRKMSDDIFNDIRARLGTTAPQLNIESQTHIGQVLGVFADSLAENWEGYENLYHSFDPTQAEGARLDQLLAQSARPARRLASSSVVELQFTGTVGTVVPAGTQVNGADSDVYLTDSDVTLGAGGLGIVTATNTSTGPIEGPAGTITQIATPVPGLSAVTNPTAAILGNTLETDGEVQARITNENSATTLAQNINGDLQAKLLNVPGVTEAVVFVNAEATADANGIPANHFAPVVLGGDEDAIADVIYSTHTSGVSSFGTTLKSVDADNLGICLPVRFSRAELIEIKVRIQVQFVGDCGCTPNSLAQIRTEIINYWEGVSPYVACGSVIGRDAFATDFFLPVLNVGGLRVTSIQLARKDLIPETFVDSIDVDFDQRITIDPSDVEVLVT